MVGPQRTATNRQSSRNNASLPYSRPTATKPSWGLSSLWNFIKPFRLLSNSTEQDLMDCASGDQADHNILNNGAQQAAPPNPLPPPPPPPAPAPVPPPPPMSAAATISSLLAQSNGSSSRNVELVTNFLNQNAHRQLTNVEIAGIVSLLKKSVDEEEEEEEEERKPFRFETHRKTPPRSTAPPPPKKPLTHNPNGVYEWNGGFSSRPLVRPPRTRYQAPGFGPPRPSSKKLGLTPVTPTDKKRRRVDTDAATSHPQSTPSTSGSSSNTPNIAVANDSTENITETNVPSSNDTTAAESLTKPNNDTTTSHAHTTTVPVKPTMPAVPSPLRQTWGQADSSSPPQPSKPTRAANFMTELIEKVTPPPRMDWLNPYQAACPVPLHLHGNRRPTKPLPKKPRVPKTASTGEGLASTSKLELSTQTIIEATVPKGVKRSRPPPEMVSSKAASLPSSSNAPRRSARLQPTGSLANGFNGPPRTVNSRTDIPAVIEEVDEADAPSPLKKQRSFTNPSSHPVTVEEVDDVDMPLDRSKRNPSSTLTPIRTSQSRRNRFSAKEEEVIDVDMPFASTSNRSNGMPPSEIFEARESNGRSTSPVISTPAFNNPFNGGASLRPPTSLMTNAPKAPSKLRYSVQADEDREDVSFPVPAPAPVPNFFASLAAVKPTSEAGSQVAAKSMASFKLPTYPLNLPTSSPGAGPSKIHETASTVSSLPDYSFPATTTNNSARHSVTPAASNGGSNWDATAMKPPAFISTGWTCSSCMLKNPDSATTKCTICQASRVASTPAPVKSFDWAAAGMSQPKKDTDSWKCGTCDLMNPGSAKEKCLTCETLRRP